LSSNSTLTLPYSFYSPSPSRDLHSFPTRRSSDLTMLLTKLKIATAVLLAVAVSTAGGLIYTTQAGAQDAPRERQQSKEDVREARSEEHTSELQSRGHLVCRLLLEKKKKQQKSRIR